MSSILKALKKLEEENATRRPETLNIDAEIVRGRPKKSHTKAGVALAAVLLFMCGAGATYFSMKRNPTTSSATVSSPSPPAPETIPPVIVPPAPQTPQKQEVLHTPLKPGTADLKPQLPHPADQVTQDHLPQQTTTKGQKKDLIQQPETRHESPATLTVKSVQMIPKLTVNGIAFQEDSADNIAVVNGTSVSRGSVVDGVTVAEIMKDRVRFTAGGEMIEVGLGKSSR